MYKCLAALTVPADAPKAVLIARPVILPVVPATLPPVFNKIVVLGLLPKPALVAPKAPVLELKVRLVLFFGCKDCVPLAVTNSGKHVVSDASFAVDTVVGTTASA